MFEQNNISSFVEEFAAKLESDSDFRNYHQYGIHKNLSKLLKCTYEEMLQLLKKMTTKPSVKMQASLDETIRSGGKVWAYFQYKVFLWVSLWLIHNQKLTQEQFTADVTILCTLFREKEERFIRFQLFLIFSRMEGYECQWSLADEAAFKEKAAQQSIFKGEMNWRFISFQLFLERSCLKSPNELRQRWMNHLNPRIHKGKWLPEEDAKLLRFYQEFGPRWSAISKTMKNRNEHMVKNRFASLKKRWIKDVKNQKKPFNIKSLIRDVNIQVAKYRKKSAQKDIEEHLPRVQEEQFKEVKPVSVLSEKRADLPQAEVSLEPLPRLESLQQKLTLSLIDVEQGFFDISKHIHKEQPIQINQQLNHYLQASDLFNDPLLKLNDRVRTSDYEWLDNMIEQKNLSWLSEEQ